MASPNAKLIAQLKALENVPWIVPVAAAEKIAEIARRNAPVKTGYLRDHIIARHYSKTSNVESRAPYSGFVEFGTRYMAAQPFLRTAIDQHDREILNAVAEAMIGEMRIALGRGSSRWVRPPASSRQFPGIRVS